MDKTTFADRQTQKNGRCLTYGSLCAPSSFLICSTFAPPRETGLCQAERSAATFAKIDNKDEDVNKHCCTMIILKIMMMINMMMMIYHNEDNNDVDDDVVGGGGLGRRRGDDDDSGCDDDVDNDSGGF